MTTAYNLRNKMYRSGAAGRASRLDPGSGGTVIVTPVDRAVCEMTGAGTRTLEDATLIGVGTSILCTSQTAAIYVAGDDTVLIGDGEWVEFIVTKNVLNQNVWAVRTASWDVHANETISIDLPFDQFRIHDAPMTLLGDGVGAVDDLGVTDGTYGTNALALNAVTGAGLTDTSYGRYRYPVPSDYVDGTDIVIACTVAEVDAAATSSTLDLECHTSAVPGTDICATAAINIAGGAIATFTITGTTVTSGSILDLRFAVANNDGGGGGDGSDHNITLARLSYTSRQ